MQRIGFWSPGPAALRNDDDHAVVPEAARLMHSCFNLERLLEPLQARQG